MRFTGRPRLIPDDGSTRSMTRSTAGTSWSGRGVGCVVTVAHPGIDQTTPLPRSRSTALTGCSMNWKRSCRRRRTARYRPGGCSSRSRVVTRSGRCRFLRCDRVVQSAVKIVLEAQGGQDPDRAPDRRWRGSRLPRLPPSAGALPVAARTRRPDLPRPLAITPGDAASPRPHQTVDNARSACRTDRASREEINTFLRGWAGYFRYGNSGPRVRQDQEARGDTSCVVHRETSPARAGLGLRQGYARVYRSPNALGLINLNGAVVAPRPNRPWRAPVGHRR